MRLSLMQSSVIAFPFCAAYHECVTFQLFLYFMMLKASLSNSAILAHKHAFSSLQYLVKMQLAKKPHAADVRDGLGNAKVTKFAQNEIIASSDMGFEPQEILIM